MEFTNCSDPTFVGGSNRNSDIAGVDSYEFKEPANTFYPPGVICAQEEYLHMCPTSGESGSPLMTSDDAHLIYLNLQRDLRLRTEGILSFIKGCTAFIFGRYVDFFATDFFSFQEVEATDSQANIVYQVSDNPLVYTRLHCYLPWIAEQYGLDFDYEEIPGDDPSCFTGFGKTDEDVNVRCTNTPSTVKEIQEGIEKPCIFPYYVDGKLINDSCVKFESDTFLDPVSRCPIWNITTKIDGINSYNSSDSRLINVGGYCPGADGTTLDPEVTCPLADKFTPFSKCKNNCRGGKCHKLSHNLFYSQECIFSCISYRHHRGCPYIHWCNCWNLNCPNCHCWRPRNPWTR